MNHLAHCFLSFENEEWLVGNFIGDYVKGNDWEDYPNGISKGILLHRTIDSFTDSHELVRQCIARVRPFAGKFAGPVTDILFDHLLVRTWDLYSEKPLSGFAPFTYDQLERNREHMPALLSDRVPKMIAGDFLRGYQTREQVAWVFSRFAHRLPVVIDYEALLDHFFSEIEAFDADFQAFFPDDGVADAILGDIHSRTDQFAIFLFLYSL